MGYFLRGFLADDNISKKIISRYAEAKKINFLEELYLIPMTDELFDEINCFEKSKSIGKFELLNEKIKSLLIDLSEEGCIAYIEADYFGGMGGQSAIVYREKQLIYFADFVQNALNCALKTFGVKRINGKDEFDTIGLGRHRYMEDWIEE